MNSRRNLDELREAMEIFEHESESLYRYDNPVESIRFFMSLSNRDQERLLYWALQEGSKNICSIANHLVRLLSPTPKDFDELVHQMQRDDISEIEEIRSELHHDFLLQTTKVPPDSEKKRIIQVLSEASQKIGFLTFEKAYWILLPHDIEEAPKWIECNDKNSPERSAFQVSQTMSREEKVKLLTLMRESLWVIHLHNHPLLPSESESVNFSSADKSFAKYWESLRPELAKKMLWGVVQGNWINGMPFPLPPHMTPRYSEEQYSEREAFRCCDSVYGRHDELQKDQVVDAHALYDSMSERQRKKLRKYIKDLKRGRNAEYRRESRAEKIRVHIPHSVVAIALSVLFAAILIYIIYRAIA